MKRRREFLYLSGGLLLAPLAACGEKTRWPEGMAEIKWDRDTCARCNMVISDPRFAAQLRGGEKQTAFKFDDIGCLVFWLRDKAAQYPWATAAATRLWVADAADPRSTAWLDAREAHYIAGSLSPMGYNFTAMREAAPQSLSFEAMRAQVLAKGQ
ncbi:MAG: nitrous oxide reductase accessory protein NosL [Zoogloeaceae bacterium]|jgi:nitrous oxide reductase accessory protein NosL|nr:nitrous oxide reductase accessory protein NosL [Zoogloeaceae bacterium]